VWPCLLCVSGRRWCSRRLTYLDECVRNYVRQLNQAQDKLRQAPGATDEERTAQVWPAGGVHGSSADGDGGRRTS
jgi:hypothetical protein